MPDFTLHLGDCLDVLKTLPDGSVDAVVTDPPYGIKLPTDYAKRGRGKLATCNNFRPVHGDEKPFDPSPWLKFSVLVLFGANHFANQLPPRARWLVWDKRDGMNSNDQADCELAWTSDKRSARLFHHRWNGMIKASERTARRCHPTQKPVALMQWVLDTMKIPVGATVFDPYMGSGTTGVACMNTGRNFIGVEIDPGYHATASQRITEAKEAAESRLIPA